MKKFIVLYMAPAGTMEEWQKQPAEVREPEEKKMQAEWGVWMQQHAAMIKETAGLGKTTRVTAQGSADTKNDLMLYSIVEGESQEAVAKTFEGHPHFGIPGATIEIMPANVLPGMPA